jgi:hypothetical protein
VQPRAQKESVPTVYRLTDYLDIELVKEQVFEALTGEFVIVDYA